MLLIVTACVNPSNHIANIAIRDENIRLEQYLYALDFFVELNSITDIIFCDNSDAKVDYSNLVNKAIKKGKQLEILQFSQDMSRGGERGKSYGELCIMDYILKNSVLLPKYSGFYKVTGRLIVENFENILKKNKNINTSKFVFLGNPINKSSKKIDTRFYYMTTFDLKKLIKSLYGIVDESKGFTLERSFYEGISMLELPFEMLPIYPKYIGISGSTGVDYSKAKFTKIKLIIKNILIRFYLVFRKE